jgi:hypothetical protein
MARVARWMPAAALALWVVATVGQAAALRATPPGPMPPAGPVLGIESVVAPGLDRLSWSGPGGRRATVAGPGRFETWRHPYFTGALDLPGERVVDRVPGWGEAVQAAWRQTPLLHGAALLLMFAVVLAGGGVPEAVALALWLRLPGALSPAWFFDSDARSYHDAAVDLLSGGLPTPQWPPLWPATLAGLYGLVGPDPDAGRLLSAALGALLVVPIAALVPAGRGRVAAALLVAASAELVAFSGSLFSEPLFLVLAAVALWAWRAGDGTLGAALGGLAAVTRAVALLPTGLLAGLGALRRGLTWRRRLGMLAVWALPVVGASAVATATAGRPALVADSAGLNLWIGHGPGATGDWREPGPAPAGGYGPAAWARIRADPAAAGARALRTTGRLWSFSSSSRTMSTRPPPLPLVPFGAVVVLAALGALRRRDPHLLLWLAATTAVVACLFAPARYKLALYPALMPLCGLGWTAGGRRPSARAASSRGSQPPG